MLWSGMLIAIGLGVLLWLGYKTRLGSSTSLAPDIQNKLNPATKNISNSPANQAPDSIINVGSQKRMFRNMSVEERNAILAEIKKEDLGMFFQTWIDSERVEHDLRKQNIVGMLLSQALRENAPSRAVMERIQTFIADDSNSVVERSELLYVLGQAKTAESLGMLLQAAAVSTDGTLKEVAIREIRSSGALWGDGTFHEELSPALERTWNETHNPEFLAAVAEAMAKVGAPSGVERLIASALGGPQDVRHQVAESALTKIMNPHAVPALAAHFVDQSAGSRGQEVLGNSLLGIGDTTAGRVLLNWLQTSEEDATLLARDFVARTRDPAMLEIWKSALDPTLQFRSEKNREAIRAGLIARDQNRKSSL